MSSQENAHDAKVREAQMARKLRVRLDSTTQPPFLTYLRCAAWSQKWHLQAPCGSYNLEGEVNVLGQGPTNVMVAIVLWLHGRALPTMAP